MKRDLQNVLEAAAAAIATGKRQPHCFSAHVPGQGYINCGDNPETLADYRLQAGRAISSEIENIGFAPAYAMRSQGQPVNGVLMANWNVFPRDFDRVLERMGYAVEWSDCYTNCDDCQGAISTQPDSFCWQPDYSFIGDGFLCIDCLQDLYPDSDSL